MSGTIKLEKTLYDIRNVLGSKIECACYVTSSNDLSKLPRKIRRIYYGAEACELFLPNVPRIKRFAELCSTAGRTMTLVMPLLSDRALPIVREVINYANAVKVIDEIVINDYGTLNLLREQLYGCKIICGRLLARQYCDPKLIYLSMPPESRRIIKVTNASGQNEFMLIETAPPHLVDTIKSIPVCGSATIKHLHEYGIDRVEINNTIQGIRIPRAIDVNISLHYPFVLSSIARRCSCRKQPLEFAGPCPLTCMDFHANFTHSLIPLKLLKKGCSIHYKNTHLHHIIPFTNAPIDRIIIHHDIPI